MDFRDVTLAYGDDTIGDLVFRDVTLAYDDDDDDGDEDDDGDDDDDNVHRVCRKI